MQLIIPLARESGIRLGVARLEIRVPSTRTGTSYAALMG